MESAQPVQQTAPHATPIPLAPHATTTRMSTTPNVPIVRPTTSLKPEFAHNAHPTALPATPPQTATFATLVTFSPMALVNRLAASVNTITTASAVNVQET